MRHIIYPLAAISAIVATSPSAKADTLRTYIYINNVLTDVTPYALHDAGHVFLNGNWVGTINSSSEIIDAENEVIGYVALVPDLSLSKK